MLVFCFCLFNAPVLTDMQSRNCVAQIMKKDRLLQEGTHQIALAHTNRSQTLCHNIPGQSTVATNGPPRDSIENVRNRAHTLARIYTHTHTHAHARTHARTHAHTHARTHARTHAHTQSHIHTCSHAFTHALRRTSGAVLYLLCNRCLIVTDCACGHVFERMWDSVFSATTLTFQVLAVGD